jgi:hypothetical protein
VRDTAVRLQRLGDDGVSTTCACSESVEEGHSEALEKVAKESPRTVLLLVVRRRDFFDFVFVSSFVTVQDPSRSMDSIFDDDEGPSPAKGDSRNEFLDLPLFFCFASCSIIFSRAGLWGRTRFGDTVELMFGGTIAMGR